MSDIKSELIEAEINKLNSKIYDAVFENCEFKRCKAISLINSNITVEVELSCDQVLLIDSCLRAANLRYKTNVFKLLFCKKHIMLVQLQYNNNGTLDKIFFDFVDSDKVKDASNSPLAYIERGSYMSFNKAKNGKFTSYFDVKVKDCVNMQTLEFLSLIYTKLSVIDAAYLKEIETLQNNCIIDELTTRDEIYAMKKKYNI